MRPASASTTTKFSDPLQNILSVWQDLPRGGSGVPKLSRFDPMSIPKFLPFVYLVRSPSVACPRFRFHILGEALLMAGAPGRPQSFVDEMPHTVSGHHLNDYLTDAVRNREPNWYRGLPTPKHHKDVVELEGIMLPMEDEQGEVTACLGLTMYHWRDVKLPGFSANPS